MEFEDFVRARGSALLRYGYVLSGNADDAADLVQEALLRLSDTWGRVRNKDSPEAYVRTTMARQHISWWRRRRRGAVWCYGRGERDSWGRLVYRADGSGTPSSVLLYTVRDGYPILDRLPADLGVYDLETGKLVIIDKLYSVGTSSEPSTILYWGTTKGDKPDSYRVLNLAAVPPAQ